MEEKFRLGPKPKILCDASASTNNVSHPISFEGIVSNLVLGNAGVIKLDLIHLLHSTGGWDPTLLGAIFKAFVHSWFHFCNFCLLLVQFFGICNFWITIFHLFALGPLKLGFLFFLECKNEMSYPL